MKGEGVSRLIKYRAFCEMCGKFVIADMRHCAMGLEASCDRHSVYTACYLSQATDLKDNDGVQIYDGDFCTGYSIEDTGTGTMQAKWVCEVRWDKENGKWICYDHDSGESWDAYDCVATEKVIGNRFEHTQLIKSKL